MTELSPVPRVSVAMPVFNMADTLPRALDSLLAQNIDDFEIVAVDDGSSDDTSMILARYAWRDERVRPLYTTHVGIVGALDRALAECRAPYVARMDADDMCHPDRLGLQADLLDREPGLGVASCLVDYGGDSEACRGYALHVDWANTLVTHDEISLNRFVESPLPHPSVMFRKSLLAEHGGFRNGDFPEDYELWLRWMDRGVRFAKVRERLLTWFDPPSRLSRTDPRYAPEAFYRVKAEYLARWLEANNPHHPRVMVAGAGRTTRKRAELLAGFGVEISAWLDIDPRKIGHTVAGRQVLAREDVPSPADCFVLSFVASRGAREDIGDFLEGRGFVLGRDWLPAA